MAKTSIILLAFLVFVSMASAQIIEATQTSIQIYSPAENQTIGLKNQDFIFEIRGPESAGSCSLVVNNEVLKTYANVQNRAKRFFTVQLPEGYYEWWITCVFSEGEISSPTYQLNVDLSLTESQCLERISMGQGRFRNVFTRGCLKNEPVVVPLLRPNDWIEITLSEKQYVTGGFEDKTNFFVVYMIKLSQRNTQPFVEFNTNRNSLKRELFINESVLLDIDMDGIDDIELTLEEIAMKRAVVSVKNLQEDYSKPIIAEPEETYEETVEQVVIKPPQETPIEEVEEETIVEVETSPDRTYVTIIIIVILLGILAYITLFQKKPAPTQNKTIKRTKSKTSPDFIIESKRRK